MKRLECWTVNELQKLNSWKQLQFDFNANVAVSVPTRDNIGNTHLARHFLLCRALVKSHTLQIINNSHAKSHSLCWGDEPGQQSGELDTLQIHLFGNLKISIILVAANLLHLLQIRKNGPSKVQNFASEIDIKK